MLPSAKSPAYVTMSPRECACAILWLAIIPQYDRPDEWALRSRAEVGLHEGFKIGGASGDLAWRRERILHIIMGQKWTRLDGSADDPALVDSMSLGDILDLYFAR